MSICHSGHGLPFDILQRICVIGHLSITDLRSFSRASRGLREAAVSELFRSVKVKVIGDWSKSLANLREMKKNLDLVRYWRSFRFELYALEEDLNSDPPTVEVCSILHSIFASATSLTYLSVVILEQHIDSFKNVLNSYNLRLPAVKTLVVGPFCEFLVPICPNLKTLSTTCWTWFYINEKKEKSKRLIRAAKEVRGLDTFEMMEYWTEDLLSLLSQSIPDVKTLSIQDTPPRLGIHGLSPLLTPFKSMRTLILPSPADLNVGFKPPFCGNAYHGPEGQELRKKVKREGIIAEGKVMDILLHSCPWVENVWLGPYRKAVVKDGMVTETVGVRWRAVVSRHE